MKEGFTGNERNKRSWAERFYAIWIWIQNLISLKVARGEISPEEGNRRLARHFDRLDRLTPPDEN